MRDIARWIGCSDVAMAGIYDRLRVPRPPMGHWARLKVGKATTPPRLPEALPGDDLEWVRTGPAATAAPRVLSLASLPEPRPPESGTPTPQRPVRGRPRARHHLLVGVEPYFGKTRSSRSGYLRPTKQLLVDVFVSASLLPWALDVADRLFGALEHRGHRVVIASPGQSLWRPHVDTRERHHGTTFDSIPYDLDSWSPIRPTVVYVGDVAIGLSIFEISEDIEVYYDASGTWRRVSERPLVTKGRRHRQAVSTFTHRKYIPSGRLCVRATSPYKGITWATAWSETSPGTMPSMIDEMIRAMESAPATLVTQIIERDRLEVIRQREAAIAWEKHKNDEAIRQHQEAIKASIQAIHELADAWHDRTHIEILLHDAMECATALATKERDEAASRIQAIRSFLNPKNPLERLLEWKTPYERLSQEAQGRLDALRRQAGPTHPVQTPDLEQVDPPAQTNVDTPRQRSYWENLHWWQRH